MNVCIIEAGQNEMPAGIKHSRRWTGEPKNVRIIAYGCDQCARYCQRTRQGLSCVPSMDVCVDDDVVEGVHSFRCPLSAVRWPLSAVRWLPAAGRYRRAVLCGLHRNAGRLRLSDLDQDHRHVVMLIRRSNEGLDLAEDALAQLA